MAPGKDQSLKQGCERPRESKKRLSVRHPGSGAVQKQSTLDQTFFAWSHFARSRERVRLIGVCFQKFMSALCQLRRLPSDLPFCFFSYPSSLPKLMVSDRPGAIQNSCCDSPWRADRRISSPQGPVIRDYRARQHTRTGESKRYSRTACRKSHPSRSRDPRRARPSSRVRRC